MFSYKVRIHSTFSKMMRWKSRSARPKDDIQVKSSSGLSVEMEARIRGLPVLWRPKCHKILEGQPPEVQLPQISAWEQLPEFTKTSCWPPASTIIKELVSIPAMVVVEPDINLDACINWFRDDEYDDEDDEEEFEDDASRWFPRELVVPQTYLLPPRLCQIAVHRVVVENALVVPEYSALPSPPSPSSSHIPLPLDLAEPLRTKDSYGIPRASPRSAIPLPDLLRPSHSRKTKKTTSRPISYSGRWLSSTQEKLGTKPLGKHILPIPLEDDFRKLEEVSHDDFAKKLDKRHKMFNGTSALGQLPVLVHPSRPASKRKVIGTSIRPTYLSGRSTSSKENWQRVEAAPLRKHTPSTLGVVIPWVEDNDFQWCHLAVDLSYGMFANELDERRMIMDDAFVTQDWD